MYFYMHMNWEEGCNEGEGQRGMYALCNGKNVKGKRGYDINMKILHCR
jgi:hypothetical protein